MATFAQASLDTHGIETGQLCFRHETHCNEVLKNLQAHQELCDVVLIAGDKRIPAHGIILIASSDYFSALLSDRMGESQKREITLNDLDGDALQKLINYCYTGSLELRGSTIEVLLTNAIQLHLKEVIDGCCEFLLRHLQPSNCLAVGFFVEQLNLEACLHKVKKFICENIKEVSNHPEFLLLNDKQLSEVLAYNDLQVPNEEFVFGILMKWIECEPNNRRKHFTKLLAQVRLSLLSPSFLAEKVEPLCNTVENLKLLLNAQKCHLQLTCNYTQPRNYKPKNAVKQLLVVLIEAMHFVIASYNLRTDKWTTLTTPLHNPNSFAVDMMDDQLIVIELSVGEQVSLTLKRIGHEIAILKDSIYAIGGMPRVDAADNSVERWDPESKTRSFVAPMEHGRSYTGMAVVNDHLYVAGGCCDDKVLSSVECYDPVENSWKPKAPMTIKRHSHCLATYKGYLLAIGGENAKQNKYMPIERYNPSTNTWKAITCSQIIYGYTRCASFGTELFIYNNSNFYVISSEKSCNKLELQIISKPTFLNFGHIKFFALPYEFNPPQKFINF